MNVLIPIHTFLPSSRYGAELYTYYLAQELRAAGAQVHILYSERGAAAGVRREGYHGLECTVLGQRAARGPGRLDRPDPAAEAAFRELLRQLRPDVVHVNHLLHLSTELPRLAQEAGGPVVFTLHDYWLRCPKVKLLDWWGRRCTRTTAWKCAACVRARYSRMTWPSLQAAPAEGAHPLKRALKEMCFQVAERPAAWHRLRQRQREMRRVIAAVDRFIAPTRFLGARLIEWGIPAEKIVYHDYGTMELPYAPRAPRRPGQRLRFGYLGGATYEKGLHVLFEAFRGFAEADLVVYGESQPWLQRQHGDILAQPNVRLAGPINDEQKAALLPQLDALVVPSIWYENSPLVIHEAFQAGVPVICSDIGGMAELVTDGVDGLHFRVEDAPDLRRVLRQCVHDPDRLERLRAGIRKPTSMREHVLREILPLYEALSADRLSTAWFVQASRMPSRLPAGSPAEPPSPGTTSAFATGPWAWQLWLGTALSPGVVQRLQSLKRQWGPPIKFFLISE